jgi:hypothetical protein
VTNTPYYHHGIRPELTYFINKISQDKDVNFKINEFRNVIKENKEKMVTYGIPKSDVHIITRLVFPGLANELVRRVHGFTKKNNSNYKRFTTMTKLSPGDVLIDMDGNHITVNTNQFVGPSGVYKGRRVNGYRKKPKLSGGKNTRKNN